MSLFDVAIVIWTIIGFLGMIIGILALMFIIYDTWRDIVDDYKDR